MSFTVTCVCKRQFGVHDRYAGKMGKCPFCGATMLLKPGEDWVPAADAKGQVSPGRSVAAPAGSGSSQDASVQTPGIRQIVPLFCPTCGTRYREGQQRCSFCHAPLSEEEIAAAKAANRPPLIPWLPRVYLSEGAKVWAVLLLLGLIGLGVYAYMHPVLARRARLQAELALVEKVLTTREITDQWGVSPLPRLHLEMPGYPWDREAEAKAYGKWTRRDAQSNVDIGGTGVYDRKKRQLRLKSAEGFTYFVALPPLLHLTVYAGDIDLLKQLLQEPDCNVNQTDPFDDTTALHVAAAARDDLADVVELLLEHGANWRIRDALGRWPVEVAYYRGNQKVFDMLCAREAKSRQKPAAK